jgi:hypothetical protein
MRLPHFSNACPEVVRPYRYRYMQAAAMLMAGFLVRWDHATCTLHTQQVLASCRPVARSHGSSSWLEDILPGRRKCDGTHLSVAGLESCLYDIVHVDCTLSLRSCQTDRGFVGYSTCGASTLCADSARGLTWARRTFIHPRQLVRQARRVLLL